jgi:hypothetical protein
VFAEHVDAQRAGGLVDIDVLTVALLAADVEPAGLAQVAPMAQRDPNERIRDSTEHASRRRLSPTGRFRNIAFSHRPADTHSVCPLRDPGKRRDERMSIARQTTVCRPSDRTTALPDRSSAAARRKRPICTHARNLAQPLPLSSGRCGRAVRQGAGSLLETTSRATSRPLRDRMSRAIAVRSPPRVARHLPTRAHSSSRSVALLLHAGPRMGGGT